MSREDSNHSSTTRTTSKKRTRNSRIRTPKSRESKKKKKLNLQQKDSFMNFLRKELKASKARLPVPLYIPNILCYLRILLSFIALYHSLNVVDFQEENTSIKRFGTIFYLYVIAMISDYFDGFFARLLHQESDFGILIDIIADNILRGCMYLTSIVHILFFSQNEKLVQEKYFQFSCMGMILFCSFIMNIEYIALLSTQMYAAVNPGHWKALLENLPFLVQLYFKNNFKNVVGGIGIFSLFAFPLLPFLYIHLQQYISPYLLACQIFCTIVLLGRLISLYVECFLIYRYFASIS